MVSVTFDGIAFRIAIDSNLISRTMEIVIDFTVIFISKFSVTFVHASLRLRNIKNRIANKIEGIGLKRTPMGVFLKHLGMEEEFFS